MIEVKEYFEVPSPPDVVWGLLSDPQAVVGCVQGATLAPEQGEDGSYDASLMVKFGPAKVTFHAKISLEFDAATMTGKVSAKGKDNQGGTRIRGAMTFKVSEKTGHDGSAVNLEGQVEVSGRLAGLIEGGAKLVVKRMSADFAEQLAAHCAGINTQSN